MIWSTSLPDGTLVQVEKAFLSKKERLYLVSAILPNGKRVGVCRLSQDCQAKIWFKSAWIRRDGVKQEITDALEKAKDILLVEQVMST